MEKYRCARCGCPIVNSFGICKSCDIEIELERVAQMEDAAREIGIANKRLLCPPKQEHV